MACYTITIDHSDTPVEVLDIPSRTSTINTENEDDNSGGIIEGRLTASFNDSTAGGYENLVSVVIIVIMLMPPQRLV